jgi:hypothetical protein
MYAAKNHESLEIILKYYDEKKLLAALKEKDRDGKSTLMYAAKNHESLEIILKYYDEDELLAALKEKDRYGKLILMYTASNPESLRIILEHLTKTQRLDVVLEKNHNSESILMKALDNPECLRIILKHLTEDQRLDAILEKDHNSESILMKALDNPECLRIIFDHLTEDQRLTVIKNENNTRSASILRICVDKPKIFKIILGYFTPDQCLELAKSKDKDILIILLVARNEESLKIFFEILQNKCLDAVFVKNTLNKSLIWYAANHPQKLKLIYDALPDNIVHVIKTCIGSLKNQFQDPALSLIRFMNDIEELATPESIRQFVDAVMDNKGIQEARNGLFTSSPSTSNIFFDVDSNQAIQECINKLDDYWLRRINRIETDDPDIEARNQPNNP